MNKRMPGLAVLALILLATSTACRSATNQPAIVVESAWGRPSPSSATTGAFYLVIRNKGTPDRLVSVQSDACGTAEMHESSMSSNGVMSMTPMNDGIEIPAKGKVEFKPGGLHIMCLEKKEDFAVGQKFILTLNFEKRGAITVEAEISEP